MPQTLKDMSSSCSIHECPCDLTKLKTPESEQVSESHNSKIERKSVLEQSSAGGSKDMKNSPPNSSTLNKVNDISFFLPRINNSFQDECLQGVTDFQVFKESITNNRNWQTVGEVIIRKIT